MDPSDHRFKFDTWRSAASFPPSPPFPSNGYVANHALSFTPSLLQEYFEPKGSSFLRDPGCGRLGIVRIVRRAAEDNGGRDAGEKGREDGVYLEGER
eukprot:382769-Amorphochlora_amoeboformis.AAC.1